jgi:hypothetical protein
MIAAFLGGWEIVLLLAVMLVIGIGFAVAVGVVAWVLYRQQRKSAPPISTPAQGQ